MALSALSVGGHRSDFHTSVLDRPFSTYRVVPTHSNAQGVLAAQVLPILAIAPVSRPGILSGNARSTAPLLWHVRDWSVLFRSHL